VTDLTVLLSDHQKDLEHITILETHHFDITKFWAIIESLIRSGYEPEDGGDIHDFVLTKNGVLVIGDYETPLHPLTPSAIRAPIGFLTSGAHLSKNSKDLNLLVFGYQLEDGRVLRPTHTFHTVLTYYKK